MLMPISAHSLLTELGGTFSYSKEKFGSKKQNSMLGRSYSATVAIYPFDTTGIEYGYTLAETIITDNSQVPISETIKIIQVYDQIYSRQFQVGLRQALMPRGSLLMPIISLGYAHGSKWGKITYHLENNGVRSPLEIDHQVTTTDSCFLSFTLKLSITRTLSINGVTKTVFKAFEFNEIKDSLKHEVGLSWVF